MPRDAPDSANPLLFGARRREPALGTWLELLEGPAGASLLVLASCALEQAAVFLSCSMCIDVVPTLGVISAAFTSFLARTRFLRPGPPILSPTASLVEPVDASDVMMSLQRLCDSYMPATAEAAAAKAHPDELLAVGRK